MEMAVGRPMARIRGNGPCIQSTGGIPGELRKRANAGKVKRSSPERLKKNHGMAAVHHSGELLDPRSITAIAVIIRHALRFRMRWESDGI